MSTLEKQKQKDFYRILLPEVPEDNIDKFLDVKEKYSQITSNKRYALDIPDVKDSKESPDEGSPAIDTPAPGPVGKSTDPLDHTPLDIPDVGADPLMDSGSLAPVEEDSNFVEKEALEVLLEIEDIKHSLSDLKNELRINDTKEDIKFEVSQMLKAVKDELEDLKSRKIPARKEYDTEGAYKEQLYPQIVNILDELLLPLIDAIPDYNLLATQVSSTYEDGTIKNAIVSLTVILYNNDYKYEFKVDVPILNGLIQSPSYLTRARKIIPLTEEALFAELNSESFIKISPDFRQKDNMFSNIGENILRSQDSQKSYPTSTVEQNSSLSDGKTWIPNKQRGISNEPK